jgi:hypothetical protein
VASSLQSGVNPFRVSPTIKNGAYPDLLADNLAINGIGKLGGKHAMDKGTTL